jgi:lysophospholipase L1-like esterase
MIKHIFLIARKAIPVLLTVSLLAVFLILIFPPGPSKKTTKILPFLKIETDYYIYDDTAGHLHKPNAKRVYHWPEHKKGKIIMQTNNMGFREDIDTKIEKPPGITRILVTGDSHIDGVVYNMESFPNQLESLLNNRGKNPRFECINGAVGHYGPQNYSGFLKRFLHLKPDIFILVLYTGNDFINTLFIEEFNGGFQTPQRPPGYYEKMEAANKILNNSFPQSLNQILLFKTFPELVDKAMEITKTHLDIINQLCKENGIQFLVALLPTKVDIEMHMDLDRIKAANEILQFSEKDFGINRQLTESLISWLIKKKINYIDLYSPMKKKLRKLFWQKDHHLNNRGHKVIARIISHYLYRSLFPKS